jgi:uncharacterized SAM-binding protein YcdF (DUF218 family)
MPRRRWAVRALVVAGIALLVALAGTWCVSRLGRWLVVEDRLDRAGAIVVLAGGFPFRAMEAAALYAQGWAPEIWVVHAAAPDKEIALTRLGLTPISEDLGTRSVLGRLGVPARAVRLLDGRARNTAEEVRLIAARASAGTQDRVILVTSKPHTRRVRSTWARLVGSRPRAMIRAARDEPFDAERWWRSSEDALAVAREVLGLLNALAGFPVRPAARTAGGG